MNSKISSETLTVMFTDIVGYTSTTTRISLEQLFVLHDVFDDISYPIFKHYGGTVIKEIGDSHLITFTSPTNAVQCGIALQKAFDEHRRETGQPLRIRVAIHTGEVLKRKNDIYGEAVNITARIESITKPNHTVFSEAVFSAMSKNGIKYVNLGYKQFKGLPHPVRLYRVKAKWDTLRQLWRATKKTFVFFILVSLIFVVLFSLLILVDPDLLNLLF